MKHEVDALGPLHLTSTDHPCNWINHWEPDGAALMPNNKAECTRNTKVSEYQEDAPLCSVFEKSVNFVES